MLVPLVTGKSIDGDVMHEVLANLYALEKIFGQLMLRKVVDAAHHPERKMQKGLVAILAEFELLQKGGLKAEVIDVIQAVYEFLEDDYYTRDPVVGGLKNHPAFVLDEAQLERENAAKILLRTGELAEPDSFEVVMHQVRLLLKNGEDGLILLDRIQEYLDIPVEEFPPEVKLLLKGMHWYHPRTGLAQEVRVIIEAFFHRGDFNYPAEMVELKNGAIMLMQHAVELMRVLPIIHAQDERLLYRFRANNLFPKDLLLLEKELYFWPEDEGAIPIEVMIFVMKHVKMTKEGLIIEIPPLAILGL